MTTVSIATPQGPSFLIDIADIMLIAGRGCRIASDGYVRLTLLNGQRTRLRQVILPVPAGKMVDHIDRNKLNNSRSNLREVTRSQNLFNRGKASHNTTGYKGVHVCKETGRFRAEIRYDGKRIKIGRFATVEDAARAYDQKALVLHGKYAVLNFPGAVSCA